MFRCLQPTSSTGVPRLRSPNRPARSRCPQHAERRVRRVPNPLFHMVFLGRLRPKRKFDPAKKTAIIHACKVRNNIFVCCLCVWPAAMAARCAGRTASAAAQAPYTRACAKFGLAGSTVTSLRPGLTTRSMSSMGTAPSRTSSPRTSAPMAVNRSSTLAKPNGTLYEKCAGLSAEQAEQVHPSASLTAEPRNRKSATRCESSRCATTSARLGSSAIMRRVMRS